MSLTREQIVASHAAQRMLSDEHFLAVLDRIVATATNRAIFSPVDTERETYRNLILAVACLREELQGDAELVEADRAREILSRNME